MDAVNPYRRFVAEQARLLEEAKGYELGGLPPAPRPELAADAPRVLFFAPHPDDECIVGALPLRLLRQSRMRVVDVAVTLGSREDRRAERRSELEGACDYLGFELIVPATVERGGIRPDARQADPEGWRRGVDEMAGLLAVQRPRVIFLPHEADWNRTHVGTHLLVTDALATLPPGFECAVVETEFWGEMTRPNLLVESSEEDVADLVAATSFHAGEVRRNPYHLFLPAWLQDNVRRGGERVGGQGAAPPGFLFATLYRLRRWRGGRLDEIYTGGRMLAAGQDPEHLFR